MWCGIGKIENLASGWKYFVSFIRLGGMYLGVIETSGSTSLFLLTILCQSRQYEKILGGLLAQKWNAEMIKIYNHVRIMSQLGWPFISVHIGFSLSGAFIFLIFLNCFTLLGWKIFPMSIYICVVPTTFIVYFCYHIGIHTCLKSCDISTLLLMSRWPREIANHTVIETSPRQGRLSLKEARMSLRAQRCITFSSAGLVTMNQEARLTFSAQIIEKTCTVLLLTQHAISFGKVNIF